MSTDRRARLQTFEPVDLEDSSTLGCFKSSHCFLCLFFFLELNSLQFCSSSLPPHSALHTLYCSPGDNDAWWTMTDQARQYQLPVLAINFRRRRGLCCCVHLHNLICYPVGQLLQLSLQRSLRQPRPQPPAPLPKSSQDCWAISTKSLPKRDGCRSWS